MAMSEGQPKPETLVIIAVDGSEQAEYAFLCKWTPLCTSLKFPREWLIKP